MGKPKCTRQAKIMTEAVTERRKQNVILRRSKSVRSSLRYIGNKFLQQKYHDSPMNKTPSLSSLQDYRRGAVYLDEPRSLTILPDFYAKEPVETILKTPMTRLEPKAVKAKKEKIKISTPPAIIAPKAAQLLQIPVKENFEPRSGDELLSCDQLRNKNVFCEPECDRRTNGLRGVLLGFP